MKQLTIIQSIILLSIYLYEFRNSSHGTVLTINNSNSSNVIHPSNSIYKTTPDSLQAFLNTGR